uniref:Uncharacterized protein n=1 Tax=uncultured marine virus TaxID=186617 RepID=A0A0F7L3K8_9VIRU|nr:hypothetical protein [uncultured marine virus]
MFVPTPKTAALPAPSLPNVIKNAAVCAASVNIFGFLGSLAKLIPAIILIPDDLFILRFDPLALI